MINGLGLFAALGASEPEALPQPQAGDPALFAAALVAALGLKQPVQVIEPVDARVVDQEVAEEAEEAEPEGEAKAAAPVVMEEAEPTTDVAPVVQARVTPDTEAIEESKTLGAVLRSAGRKVERAEEKAPASVTGQVVDRMIDEPARPDGKAVAPLDGSRDLPDTKDVEASQGEKKRPSSSDAGTELPKPEQWSAPRHEVAPAAPQVIAPPLPQPVVSVPVAPRAEPPESQAPAHAVESQAADRGAAPAIVPPAVTHPARKPVVDAAKPGTYAATPVVNTAKPQVLEGQPEVPADSAAPQPVVPPQSNEERTSRAIAENTRVERQLAELLGEHEVTEFKVQLAPRRPGRASATPTPPAYLAGPDAPDVSDPSAPTVLSAPVVALEREEPRRTVVWQRVQPIASGDTISGQTLPQAPARGPKPPVAPEGTFSREAVAPQPLIQQGNVEPLTRSTVTSRSEIVRMVANASRAMSPNLTQAEGSPTAGKTPAPSIAPSLPVGRQELPDAAPRPGEASGEDPKRREPRETAENDASPSSTMGSANYSSGATTRATAPEARETREARNLPSPGSTDTQAAGSADRVTLQVADDEGRQTRIRVSVTGSQIRAVITPPDSASARQLEQRMDQLHETLVRAGFADPKLVVRAAPEGMNDIATMANAASQETRSAVPAGRDQPAGEQRQGRGQGQREQDRGDGHRHPQGHSRERDPRDRRR